MPSTSAKQHKFMEAIAHGMKPKKGGPSEKVARDFVDADKKEEQFEPEIDQGAKDLDDAIMKRNTRIRGKRGTKRR